MLSLGVPMLLGGDELGRTQQGNNNAYCQDNELSWYDWSAADGDLLAFTSALVKFRRAHPVFRRRRYATGVDVLELGWFTPSGTAMTQGDWDDKSALAIGVYLDGSQDPDLDADGQPLVDDDFLVLVNAWWEPLEFAIPATRDGQQWQEEIDTYESADAVGASLGAGEKVTVGPRSVLVLRSPLKVAEAAPTGS
jgi:glycogen operon protein